MVDKQKIRELNDRLRKGDFSTNGFIMYTEYVKNLKETNRVLLLKAMEAFNEFTPENDPYEEHDFGVIKMFGESFYWKIDYHEAKNIGYCSEDPSDITKTKRCLTLMHSSEY